MLQIKTEYFRQILRWATLPIAILQRSRASSSHWRGKSTTSSGLSDLTRGSTVQSILTRVRLRTITVINITIITPAYYSWIHYKHHHHVRKLTKCVFGSMRTGHLEAELHHHQFIMCISSHRHNHQHKQISYQAPLGFDERSIGAVHLVVEPAGVAQVVTVPVSAPQRGWSCSAIHALATFCKKGIEVQARI